MATTSSASSAASYEEQLRLRIQELTWKEQRRLQIEGRVVAPPPPLETDTDEDLPDACAAGLGGENAESDDVFADAEGGPVGAQDKAKVKRKKRSSRRHRGSGRISGDVADSDTEADVPRTDRGSTASDRTVSSRGAGSSVSSSSSSSTASVSSSDTDTESVHSASLSKQWRVLTGSAKQRAMELRRQELLVHPRLHASERLQREWLELLRERDRSIKSPSGSQDSSEGADAQGGSSQDTHHDKGNGKRCLYCMLRGQTPMLFSSGRLKRNCANCGRSMCSRCSKHRMALPRKGNTDKMQRVCDDCHERLTQPDAAHLHVVLKQTGGIERDYWLAELPKCLWQLQDLVELDLSDNKLTSVPTEVCDVTSIRCLDLSKNKLETLPNHIGALTKLVRLKLDRNQLVSLPDNAFSGMDELEELDLAHNQLPVLPSSLFSRKQLKKLDIGDNPQLSLYQLSRLGGLASLEYLDIGGLNIRRLPSSIHLLKELRVLKINHNHIEFIGGQIANLLRLQHFNASHNNLRTWPEAVLLLPDLRHLQLAHNKNMTLTSRIGGLFQLEKLDLDGCALSELPLSLAHMTGLEQLLLAHTHLQRASLPVQLGRLNSLCELRVDGQNLHVGSKESLPGLLRSWRSAEAKALSSQTRHLVHVHLWGSTSSGKSSLLQQLVSGTAVFDLPEASQQDDSGEESPSSYSVRDADRSFLEAPALRHSLLKVSTLEPQLSVVQNSHSIWSGDTGGNSNVVFELWDHADSTVGQVFADTAVEHDLGLQYRHGATSRSLSSSDDNDADDTTKVLLLQQSVPHAATAHMRLHWVCVDLTNSPGTIERRVQHTVRQLIVRFPGETIMLVATKADLCPPRLRSNRQALALSTAQAVIAERHRFLNEEYLKLARIVGPGRAAATTQRLEEWLGQQVTLERPIVLTSSMTGAGLNELHQALASCASTVLSRRLRSSGSDERSSPKPDPNVQSLAAQLYELTLAGRHVVRTDELVGFGWEWIDETLSSPDQDTQQFAETEAGREAQILALLEAAGTVPSARMFWSAPSCVFLHGKALATLMCCLLDPELYYVSSAQSHTHSASGAKNVPRCGFNDARDCRRAATVYEDHGILDANLVPALVAARASAVDAVLKRRDRLSARRLTTLEREEAILRELLAVSDLADVGAAMLLAHDLAFIPPGRTHLVVPARLPHQPTAMTRDCWDHMAGANDEARHGRFVYMDCTPASLMHLLITHVGKKVPSLQAWHDGLLLYPSEDNPAVRCATWIESMNLDEDTFGRDELASRVWVLVQGPASQKTLAECLEPVWSSLLEILRDSVSGVVWSAHIACPDCLCGLKSVRLQEEVEIQPRATISVDHLAHAESLACAVCCSEHDPTELLIDADEVPHLEEED